MAKASTVPVPARVEDLTQEGLVFLLRTVAPHIYPGDLASARWHELVLATERANNAWKAANAEANAAFDRVRVGSKTYHQDCLTRDAARVKERRAWRAYERADDAADAFFNTHVCPPRPSAPAADEDA